MRRRNHLRHRVPLAAVAAVLVVAVSVINVTADSTFADTYYGAVMANHAPTHWVAFGDVTGDSGGNVKDRGSAGGNGVLHCGVQCTHQGYTPNNDDGGSVYASHTSPPGNYENVSFGNSNIGGNSPGAAQVWINVDPDASDGAVVLGAVGMNVFTTDHFAHLGFGHADCGSGSYGSASCTGYHADDANHKVVPFGKFQEWVLLTVVILPPGGGVGHEFRDASSCVADLFIDGVRAARLTGYYANGSQCMDNGFDDFVQLGGWQGGNNGGQQGYRGYYYGLGWFKDTAAEVLEYGDGCKPATLDQVDAACPSAIAQIFIGTNGGQNGTWVCVSDVTTHQSTCHFVPGPGNVGANGQWNCVHNTDTGQSTCSFTPPIPGSTTTPGHVLAAKGCGGPAPFSGAINKPQLQCPEPKQCVSLSATDVLSWVPWLACELGNVQTTATDWLMYVGNCGIDIVWPEGTGLAAGKTVGDLLSTKAPFSYVVQEVSALTSSTSSGSASSTTFGLDVYGAHVAIDVASVLAPAAAIRGILAAAIYGGTGWALIRAVRSDLGGGGGGDE